MRIVSSSYDGSLGFTDIQRAEFNRSNESYEDDLRMSSISINNRAQLPIIMRYARTDVRDVPIQHTQSINYEGIGYLESFGNFFVSSAFDGCATAWNLAQGDALMDASKVAAYSKQGQYNPPSHSQSQYQGSVQKNQSQLTSASQYQRGHEAQQPESQNKVPSGQIGSNGGGMPGLGDSGNARGQLGGQPPKNSMTKTEQGASLNNRQDAKLLADSRQNPPGQKFYNQQQEALQEQLKMKSQS